MRRSGRERPTQLDRLVSLLAERGLIRSRELSDLAIDQKTVARAVTTGLVERRGPGIYGLPGAVDPHLPLALICKRVPHAVLCLDSALWFHGFITEQPIEVWIAIDHKARVPKLKSLPLRIVRFSGDALTRGVVNLTIGGSPVRVYSPMKTVADLFKYRNKVGTEPAIAALNASIQSGKYNRQKLIRFAEICRVKRIVMDFADEAEHAVMSGSPATARQEPATAWDRDLLQQQVWSEPLKQLAPKYGVSDVALAKRCKKMNIPLPGRGYWAKKSAATLHPAGTSRD